jgi:Xaa-Pro aminopeptidase
MSPAFLDQLSEYVNGGIRQELAFPIADYQDRVSRACARMAETGLDALLLTYLPTICYLTGYQFTNCDYTGYLLLHRSGSGAMVVPGTEVGAVLMHGWVRDVRDFPSWLPVQAVPIISQVLQGWQAADGVIGVESQLELMDPLILEHLTAGLPGAEFRDVTDLLWADRAIKSEAELRHITQAGRYSDTGILAAVRQATQVSGEHEVAAAAAEAMILAGSEFFATAPLVAAGERTALPRTSFGRGAVPHDGPAVIELAGVYQRYCSPLMRTVLAAGSNDTLEQLLDAAQAGLRHLVEMARPGNHIGAAVESAQRVLTDAAGGDEPPWSLGHSVGICLPPSWDEAWLALSPDATGEFRPGMVFYGSIRLGVQGIGGIGVGDTWHVTDTGARVVSAVPQNAIANLAGDPR